MTFIQFIFKKAKEETLQLILLFVMLGLVVYFTPTLIEYGTRFEVILILPTILILIAALLNTSYSIYYNYQKNKK
jgi:hypothetical protein